MEKSLQQAKALMCEVLLSGDENRINELVEFIEGQLAKMNK
jgi:hypothetical protein